MQNIQNADFSISEQQQQSNENTLSKSADTLSAKELILQLNDNFIARKSKEYNFDFNKACSYDTAICESGGLLAVQQDNLFSSNFKVEKPKEIKLTGRKTSFSTAFNTNENKVEKIYEIMKFQSKMDPSKAKDLENYGLDEFHNSIFENFVGGQTQISMVIEANGEISNSYKNTTKMGPIQLRLGE